MASLRASQSFYNNDEAYQTTLSILMETTADVHFIFEIDNGTATEEQEMDTTTAADESSSSKIGDGETKMDSQDTVELNAVSNDGEIGANDSQMDEGETSGAKMNDDAASPTSQEIVDLNSASNDGELNTQKAGDASTSGGKMGDDGTKMESQSMDEEDYMQCIIKSESLNLGEPGASNAGSGAEEMEGQHVNPDMNVSFNAPEIVKIPAHKNVLAKLSSVFDAEFNGPLKETGDVRMVGTTPFAFRKFLQFFYEQQIGLTMDSVEDVMSLIDRYDVKTAWPICVKYLQKKLTVDDILWGLHLAVKYRLDELKLICTDKIRKNCAKVCGMIALDEHGKPKLLSNPNNRPLCDADLVDIFPLVYSSINLHLSNPTMLTDREIDANVIPLTLITGNLTATKPLGETHYFTIASNTRLWLTHIEFSCPCDEDLVMGECNVKMWIQEKDQVNNSEPITLLTHTLKATYDEEDNRVQIAPNPIEIKPNHFTYRVYAQMSPFNPPVYANETIPTNRAIEVAPNTFITFINSFERGTLAKALFFRAQQPA